MGNHDCHRHQTALLYFLLRHAVLLGWDDSASPHDPPLASTGRIHRPH
jgi:hypothetical protein